MMETPDLPATIEFYVQVLGFTCDKFDEGPGWAGLHRDSVYIMLARPNDHEPFEKPVFTGSFYINTDDVEAWWARLKDRVRVCYPIESFGYGMREFGIYDNNGYLLQFGQPLPGNGEA
jgi:uncharacterized glyoxalase superfamily protein PhnB